MSFARKLTIAFAAIAFLAILTAGLLIVSLRQVVLENDHVIDVQAMAVIGSDSLDSLANRMAADARGFLVSGDRHFLDRLEEARGRFKQRVIGIRALGLGVRVEELLQRIEEAQATYVPAIDAVIAARRGDTQSDALAKLWLDQVGPRVQALEQSILAFEEHVRRTVENARQAASSGERTALVLSGALMLATFGAAIALALWLRRSLSGTIGGTVQHLQGASVAIDAATTEQANRTIEQHTAIVQVTSTINELLTTSKRILENTQRVATIAVKTEGTAKEGVRIGEDGVAAMAAIRAQTDAIVANMIDLSRRCQQIGAVVDVINELTEQTTILAINASIEAIGAGEAGNRFAAVADEIRRLAERVRTSTRDIRGHVEGVRSGANSMVLSTEEGAKTVTAGAARQAEVGRSFEAIAILVHSALDDAREIELSAKQQSSAVEQVSAAVGEVGEAARQAESATRRMQSASSDLARLASDLRQKVL